MNNCHAVKYGARKAFVKPSAPNQVKITIGIGYLFLSANSRGRKANTHASAKLKNASLNCGGDESVDCKSGEKLFKKSEIVDVVL